MKGLFLFLACSLLIPVAVLAGAGHDHGNDTAPAVTNPNAPQRLPDGSLFLPKPTQRFIQLRTQPAELETLPRSITLNGQIVASMDARSKVQVLQTGRLVIPDGRLPTVGESVRKGQHLATLLLAKDAQEGTNQAAEVADLQEQLKLAKLEYRRLQGLREMIPRREVDTAAATVRSLQARIAVFRQAATGSAETVVAPISGIVTGSYAANGQAVQAGDVLLEIIAPDKLQVEAVTYDPTLPANLAAATLVNGKQSLPLRYQGNSPQLRQQALPLRFSVAGKNPGGLIAGSPVQVMVQTRETLQGVAVPAQALARNPSNQTVVWVKTAPEQYTPRVVQYQPLDGQRVMLTQGVQGGERIVVHAANLINQIR